MTLDALKVQFGYTHFAIKANTEGLNHEESCYPPSPAGNCMNWVVGHILTGRNSLLKILRQEPIWSEGQVKRYQRGSGAIQDPGDAVAFDKLLEDLETSQARLMSALETFDLKRLGEPASISPTSNKKETIGSLLAALAFHEAYHSGQTGLIRRLIGKEGVIQ
jgi:hypothetical protein